MQGFRAIFSGAGTYASVASASGPSNSQNSAAGGNLVTPAPSSATTAASSTPAPTNSTAQPDPSDPVAILRQAMVGVIADPSNISLSNRTQTNYYPGGSYTQHLIEVDINGHPATYIDADLMKLDPSVAAYDVKRTQDQWPLLKA